MIMYVLARPRFAPFVPSETRNIGAVLVPNWLISLRWCPPGAVLATTLHLMLLVCNCRVTRLRQSANREKTSTPWLVLW